MNALLDGKRFILSCLLVSACAKDASVGRPPPFESFLETSCPLDTATLEDVAERDPLESSFDVALEGTFGSLTLSNSDTSGLSRYRYRVVPGTVDDLEHMFRMNTGAWTYYSDEERASVDFESLELPGCAFEAWAGPMSMMLELDGAVRSLDGSFFYSMRDLDASFTVNADEFVAFRAPDEGTLVPSVVQLDALSWHEAPQ